MICRECKKRYKKGPYNKLFCSSKCLLSWHNRARKDAVRSIAVKPVMRFCLGVYCRGKKLFKSYGLANRICDKCSVERPVMEEVNPLR